MNVAIHIDCDFLGNQLPSCIWNASGPWCTTQKDLLNLNKSSSALILTKSTTLHPREGNPSPRYQDIPYGSINAMGLPNKGIDFYLDHIGSHPTTKPYVISVAGLSLEDNIQIVRKINRSSSKSAINALEINLSCPNLVGKPQVAYDFVATEEMLQHIFDLGIDIPIGIKLPPYFDLIHFEQLATILCKFPLAFITVINSIGNALFVDFYKESVVIKPKNGFGGLGGMYIKPTALANVRKWYELLPNIPIIGCGGITTGKDIFEHILCGATAVQVGTAYMQEGIDIFQRLSQELKDVMREKQYTSLAAYRGKLNVL